MAYHCGIGPGVELILGVPARDPHITCDGCGEVRSVMTVHGRPTQWFLNRKKAPGWTAKIHECTREDWCPACKEKTKP